MVIDFLILGKLIGAGLAATFLAGVVVLKILIIRVILIKNSIFYLIGREVKFLFKKTRLQAFFKFSLLFKWRAVFASSFLFSAEELTTTAAPENVLEVANTPLPKMMWWDYFFSQGALDSIMVISFLIFLSAELYCLSLKGTSHTDWEYPELREDAINSVENIILGSGTIALVAIITNLYRIWVKWQKGPEDGLDAVNELKNELNELITLFFNGRNRKLLEFLNKKDNCASPDAAARWVGDSINTADDASLNEIKGQILNISAELKKRGFDSLEVIMASQRAADAELVVNSSGQLQHDVINKKINVALQCNLDMPFDALRFPAGENACFFIFDKMVNISIIFLLFSLIILLFFFINILLAGLLPERSGGASFILKNFKMVFIEKKAYFKKIIKIIFLLLKLKLFRPLNRLI